MKNNLSKYKYYYIQFGYILLLLLSVLLKNDLLIKFNCGVVVALAVLFILKNEKLLLIMTLVLSILSQFFVDEFNFPQILQYLPDVLAIFVLIKIINKFIKTKEKINNSVLKYIGLMFFLQVLSFIANDYSILIFLWGCRNLYRFFIVFIGVQYLYDFKDYRKITNYLKYFVIVQLFISIYQSRIYSDWDNVSGFFGHKGTGMLLVYLMFACSFFAANYFHNKIKILTFIILVGLILIELILGSVRAAFFYIPALIAIMFILEAVFKRNLKEKIKNIAIICIIVPLIIVIGTTVFLKVFSTKSEFSDIAELYSLNYIEKIASSGSYNSDGKTINRLSGIKTINDLVLDDNYKKIIGVGLGNAAPNKFNVLQGIYYRNFSELNYNWFFVPYYVMENGFLGLIVFLSIIISLLIKGVKIYKRSEDNEEKILIFAYQGCAISILLTLIYNASFNTAQIGYFFWAISGLIISLENKYLKN